MSEEHVPTKKDVTYLAFFFVLAVVAGLATGVIVFGAPGWPGSPAAGDTTVQEVAISLSEFTITAVPATVFEGSAVRFVVTNDGTVQHDFKVDGARGTERLDPGATGRFSTDPVRSPIKAWCTILGHREQGMEVTILTEERPPAPKNAP